MFLGQKLQGWWLQGKDGQAPCFPPQLLGAQGPWGPVRHPDSLPKKHILRVLWGPRLAGAWHHLYERTDLPAHCCPEIPLVWSRLRWEKNAKTFDNSSLERCFITFLRLWRNRIKMKSYIEKVQKQGRMQLSSILVSTLSTVAWDHFSGEGTSFHPPSYWPIKYSLPSFYGSLYPRLKFSLQCLAKLQGFLNSKDASSNTFYWNVFMLYHSNPCY